MPHRRLAIAAATLAALLLLGLAWLLLGVEPEPAGSHMRGPDLPHPATLPDADRTVVHPVAPRPFSADATESRPDDRLTPTAELEPAGAAETARAIVITGRAVRPDGTPWVRATLRIRLQVEGTDPWDAPAAGTSTDQAGRFSIPFDGAALDHLAPCSHVAVALDDPPADAQRGTSASRSTDVALGAAIGPGSTDLGEVVLEAEPRLAGGVVVTRDGSPVPAAELRIQRRVGSSDLRLVVAEGQTNRRGHFTFQGAAPEGDLEITAWTRDHYTIEKVPFRAGADDLRIVVDQAGALKGSFAPLDGLDPLLFEVWLEGDPARSDAVAWSAWSKRSRLFVTPAGTFAAEALRPGVARVSIAIAGREQPVAVVEGVTIRPGETTEDPRLVAIAWSGLAHAITVTTTDADGAPLPGTTLWWTSGERWERTLTGSAGTARLLRVDAPLHLLAQKTGFRPARARDVRDDARLLLARASATPIEIRLSDPEVVPAPPFSLHATLEWIDDGEGSGSLSRAGEPVTMDTPSFGFRPDGRATGSLWEPGRYRVRLMMKRATDRGTTAIGVGLETELRVEPGHPSETVINVTAADLVHARRFLDRL